VWGLVQPILARQTRVCSYDRAGIGYSDPARRASTTLNIVDDLRRVLHTARISPPYIMVGHSLGGLNVQQYAYRYPREVAGMVLVDPAYDAEFQDSSGSRCRSAKMAKLLDQFRICAAAASNGFAAGTELYGKCIDTPDSQPNAHFGPAINRALAAVQMRPAFQRAQLSEYESLCASSTEEVRAVPRRPYGDMPLEVLTGGEPAADPSSANSDSQEKWAAHEAVAKLSTRGVHRSITDSGHYIQLDRPEAVVTAVEGIVGRIREHR
jgi:pimeloyl-ACP methyl ester carboxylesterase